MFSNSYENKFMDVKRIQFHLATTAELLLVAQQQTQLQDNGASAEHAAEARSTGRDVAARRPTINTAADAKISFRHAVCGFARRDQIITRSVQLNNGKLKRGA